MDRNRALIWAAVGVASIGFLVAARLRSGESSGVSVATNTKAISAKEFGEAYPFTVDGELICEGGAVLLKVDGSLYAVNGTAQGKYRDAAKPLDGIWKDDPKMPGTKMSVADVITQGQKLCL